MSATPAYLLEGLNKALRTLLHEEGTTVEWLLGASEAEIRAIPGMNVQYLHTIQNALETAKRRGK